MSFYPPKVSLRSKEHRRAGEIENEDADGISVSFECAAYVKMSLAINARTLTITDSRFRTNGCGYMIAAADVLCERLAGRTLGDLHGLLEGELVAIVAGELGEFPAARLQCASVVFEALRAGLAKYRKSRIEEFQGENALICTCFGVDEDTLIELIATKEIDDLDQVARFSRAGSGCGSCRMLIQELIESDN